MCKHFLNDSLKAAIKKKKKKKKEKQAGEVMMGHYPGRTQHYHYSLMNRQNTNS